MGATSTPFTVILLTAVAVDAILAVYAFIHRRTAASLALGGLMVAAAFHSFGYAFELASPDLAGMMFWTHIEYLGIVSLPIFWILLAARYTGRDKWLTRPVMGFMVLFAAATLTLNYTNSWHHLYYKSLGVDAGGPFPVIAIGKGLWYWINQVYINAAVLIGNVLLIGSYRQTSPAFRRQTRIVIVGSLIPWVGYIVYLAGASPHNIDLTSFGFALSGPVFAWGLFRYRLLDLVPIAREAVFVAMSDGVVVLDALNRVIDFNSAARTLFPSLDARVVGNPVAQVLKEQPRIIDLISGDEDSVAEIIIDRGDERRYYHGRLSIVKNRRGKAVGRVILLNNATEEVNLREKLRALASIDELTGSYNRRHFLEVGKKEIARAKRSGHALSLIIIDLDHFKSINDLWGHEAGDRALQEACSRIKNGLRAADTFGRHGGEEFVVLLPETPPSQAQQVAERLRASVAATPVRVEPGAAVPLTASLGTAGVDRVGEETLEDLIRAADRAMYQAKAAGRNCVRSADGVTSTTA